MRPTPSASRELLPGLRDLPGHLFWRAHARVVTTLNDVMPSGVDIHAYAVLLALGDGVPRSQQELADAMLASRTTIARVADGLAARGLVDRVRNPEDRRSYLLTRTDEGARVLQHWRTYVDDVSASFDSGFTARERTQLLRLLQRICDAGPDRVTVPELRSSTGFLLTRIHLRMHRRFLETLEPLGIEPRDFGALTALRVSGPMTQAGLARVLGVSGPTVVEIVDRLEQHGLVERRRSPADRRSHELHLTRAAAPVLRKAERLSSQKLAEELGGLSEAETERLVGLLQRFVTEG